MTLIFNGISILSTLLILFFIIDFFWRIIAAYIVVFQRQIISYMKVHSLLSLITIFILYYSLNISFYLPW